MSIIIITIILILFICDGTKLNLVSKFRIKWQFALPWFLNNIRMNCVKEMAEYFGNKSDNSYKNTHYGVHILHFMLKKTPSCVFSTTSTTFMNTCFRTCCLYRQLLVPVLRLFASQTEFWERNITTGNSQIIEIKKKK